MTISLKHAFASPVADQGGSDIVGPDEWNAEHTLTVAADRVLGRRSTSGAVQELTGDQIVAMAATLAPTTPIGTGLALNISQIGSGTVSGTDPTITGYAYNHIYIPASGIDTSGITSNKVANGLVVDIYANNGSKGNVQGIWGSAVVAAGATVDTSQSWGYAGVVGLAKSSTNLGGTGGTPSGALFGGNFVAISDTTNLYGCVGIEIDIQTTSNTSGLARKLGLSVVDFSPSTAQGSVYDAALAIGASGGAVGWKYGLLFSPNNGGAPMNANGILIGTLGSATTTSGVDISSYAFTGSAFKSPGFNVNGSGDTTANSLTLTTVAKLLPLTFITLPGSPAVGQIAYISDCNTVTWGANAAGSSTNKVLVWYNGSNWTVIGK